MSTDLTFFTNEPNAALVDRFKSTLHAVQYFDVLVSYLSEKYIIEEIYHLAAILSSKAEKNPELAEDVNVKGTINLFNLALNQNLKNNPI